MVGNWPDTYFYRSTGPVYWYNLINPIWWLGNKDDPVDDNPEYLPDKPHWYRYVRWAIRNPLCNLLRYGLGFWARQDLLNHGEQWPVEGRTVTVAPPFFCFRKRYVEGYIGWKPRQGHELGWAFRRSHAKGPGGAK